MFVEFVARRYHSNSYCSSVGFRGRVLRSSNPPLASHRHWRTSPLPESRQRVRYRCSALLISFFDGGAIFGSLVISTSTSRSLAALSRNALMSLSVSETSSVSPVLSSVRTYTSRSSKFLYVRKSELLGLGLELFGDGVEIFFDRLQRCREIIIA